MDNLTNPPKDKSTTIIIYVSVFMIILLIGLAIFFHPNLNSPLEKIYKTSSSENKSISESNIDTDIQQAKTLWTEGKYTEMIEPTSHAIYISTTNEDKAYGYYWRGVSYYKQNMPEKSKADLDQAILLYPTFDGPYVTRAGVDYLMGDIQAEFKDSKKAVELDPTDPWAHNTLGLSYSDLGNKTEAIKELQKAIALDPDTSVFRLNLTRVRGN